MPLMNTMGGGASDTDAVCRASALLSELGRRQEVPPFVISLSPRGSDAAVAEPSSAVGPMETKYRSNPMGNVGRGMKNVELFPPGDYE